MDNVSRPLIALLGATVAFFALWIVALKPSSPASGTLSPSAPPAAASASSLKTKPADAAASHTQADRVARVNSALEHHRVVVLLFYNPAGSDDRAVRRELASVPTHHGRVLKLAVPIVQLARYPVVSTQVPVTESPTLVLVDSQRQASKIEGFTDRFEIAGRVDQALAVR